MALAPSSIGSQFQLPVPVNSGPATIIGLSSGIAWRQHLRRASFRSAQFYVDTSVRESGRRVVNHEFPKRNAPYAEDMGRRAIEFTVRGYCIVFGSETMFPSDVLKKKNYIPARDALIRALETDGPANLQLPLLGMLNVMALRYRVTEEEKFGGYCVFDMTFTEFGQAPATGTRDSAAGVGLAATNLGNAAQTAITNGITAINSGAATTTSGSIST
jgi:prophage DNA circulation protein